MTDSYLEKEEVLLFMQDLSSITALLPAMVKQRSGHIVVISSVQGKIAIPYRSACKFGLINCNKKKDI